MDTVSASFDVMAEGFVLAEAPRDDGEGGFWFTDALAGGAHHWVDGEVSTTLADRKGMGGLVVRRSGGVVVSGRDLTVVDPDGSSRVLLAPPEGVTGFNDIAAAADGGVLAGALRFRPFAGDEPVPGDLWHVDAGGAARRAATGIRWANGLSAVDDGTVVMCDYADGRVLRIDPGSGAVEVLGVSPSGEADGLALDRDGGIWVALGAAGAVGRLDPSGTWTHRLEVPAAFVSSLAFVQGGEVLLVTTFATQGQTGVVLCCAAPVPGVVHAVTEL